jgi:Flp pilus assembly protein TadG
VQLDDDGDAVSAVEARRRKDRERGQSLVEFAFVFPIIAFLAFAFIDIGRAAFQWNTLGSAARQAARVAVVNQVDPASAPWSCLANKPVESVASPNWTFRGCGMTAGGSIGVRSSDITASYAPPPGTTLECSSKRNVGCIVTITITSRYVPITPVAGSVIGPITMTATSSMPIERTFP